MEPPFLGLRLNVSCVIPAGHVNSARGRNANGTLVFRNTCEDVVRPAFPKPIGSRFGVVAEALLALPKRCLSPLAILDVGIRPVPFL